MKVLLVSPESATRDVMRSAVSALERRGYGPLEFIEATDGVRGIELAWQELPGIVMADEISSHAGAFALARDLRGQDQPFPGIIAILLDRAYDTWLAKWSGADAWFVKPVDPFAIADRLSELVPASTSASKKESA